MTGMVRHTFSDKVLSLSGGQNADFSFTLHSFSFTLVGVRKEIQRKMFSDEVAQDCDSTSSYSAYLIISEQFGPENLVVAVV